MPRISINSFTGELKSVSPRLLPDGGARFANNCDLSSGSLDPFRQTTIVAAPALTTAIRGIYQYTDKNGVKSWLHWDNLTHVERAPFADDTSARIYYTGDGAPKVTNSDRLNEVIPYYTLGVPAPDTAPVATVDNAGTTPTERLYAVTFVTAWGEESKPSLLSSIVSVGTGGQVTLSSIPQSANDPDRNPVTKIYIYRSSAGTESTKLRFLAEVPHGTTSYVDTIADSVLALNEPIPSLDWDEPPTDLFNLLSMAGGFFVGLRQHEICFTPPYQPHAWPEIYRLPITDTIIGAGVFGNRIVVLTNKHARVVVVDHPENVSPTKLSDSTPCLSAAGIVSMLNGVVFPSADGLRFIGAGGSRLVTRDYYSQEDWQAINPGEIVAAQWGENYVAFTSAGGFLFDLDNANRNTQLGYAATAVHSNTDDGDLYFNSFADSANRIHQFHSSGVYESTDWWSKDFYYPRELNFSAGIVYAEGLAYTDAEITAIQAQQDAVAAANALLFSAGIEGEINGNAINELVVNGSILQDLPSVPPANRVTLSWYVDQVLQHQATVSNGEFFRLPMISGNDFSIRLETPMRVKSVIVATSGAEVYR